MTEEMKHPLSDYLRMDRLPHIWCAGCGLGIILHSYVEAIQELSMDLDKIVTISGIGCPGGPPATSTPTPSTQPTA